MKRLLVAVSIAAATLLGAIGPVSADTPGGHVQPVGQWIRTPGPVPTHCNKPGHRYAPIWNQPREKYFGMNIYDSCGNFVLFVSQKDLPTWRPPKSWQG